MEGTRGGGIKGFNQFSTSPAAGLLLIAAAYYLLLYLIVAAMRLGYPFELEYMEGGAVVQVQRILDGLPLYDKPSLRFVAYLYAPLYFYVSALRGLAFGNGFFTLRFVSYVASLGCFGFIFLIVRHRTASVFASFVAACLFAAEFAIAGAWFDLARV